MTADLHTRLRAAIQEKLDLAKAATPGPWEHVDHADPEGQPLTSDGQHSTYMGCGSVITMGEDVMGGSIAAPNGDLYSRGGYSPKEDMAFIAAHDPAWAIGQHEAALRVLERHRPVKHPGYPEQLVCDYCHALCHSRSGLGCDSPDAPYPCGEIHDLADAYGVEAGRHRGDASA